MLILTTLSNQLKPLNITVMKNLRHYVLPVQIVALFVLPAMMLTIIISAIATMFVILSDLTFMDVTTSGITAIFGVFGYVGMLIAVGQWMWDEQ